VILNLAVNARDAMPRGGRLTIEVRNASWMIITPGIHADVRPGPYVLLAVSDTALRHGRHRFGPHVRAVLLDQGDPGHGLGLATVYGIIKQSGGHVAVL